MEAAFDHTAATYDSTFTHSPVGRSQRERVWKWLSAYLPEKALDVLEINGGTGEDAQFLADMGHNVTCTDAAPNMVEYAREKALSKEADIRFEILDLTAVAWPLENERFELIFSNFGGLNCLSEEELKHLFPRLADRLVSNGHLIAMVMPPYCVWESLYFLLKGQWNQIFRRAKKGPLPVPVNGRMINTWYYSPSQFRKLAAPYFQMIRKRPVGICLPPSYLDPLMTKFSWILKACHFFEKILGHTPLLASISDHYYIELRLRS